MHGVALVPSSRLDVLWLDNDFSLNLAGFNDETLDEARELPPGTFLSPPVAVTLGPDRLAVFGIGPDYSMDHWLYDASAAFGTRWQSGESLGVGFSSTPSAVSSGDSHIDLFALGLDLGMLHTIWNGSSWTAWDELGGGFTSVPVVLPAGSGTFDIFARGLDFMVYYAHWTVGGPPDWQQLGGGLLGEPSAASAPAVVRVGGGTIVFVTAADGSVRYTEYDGTVWKPWTSMGPAVAQAGDKNAVTFISEPVAVALYPRWPVPDIGPAALPGATAPAAALPPSLISDRTRVEVFAVGSDNALWQKKLDHTGWQPPGNWASLGGSFACAPSIVAPSHAVTPVASPPAYLALVEPSTDGTVHRWSFDPTPTPGSSVGAWGEDQPPRPAFRLPSRYTFAVDKVQIDNTRSIDNDTDIAVASLAVGNWPPQSIAFGGMGDVNNGVHQLDDRLAITRLVELCEPVVFTYSIVNNHDSGDEAIVVGVIVKGLEDWVNDLLKGGSTSLISSLLGAGVAAFADRLVGLAFGGCDGVVAAEAIGYSNGRNVQQQIANHGTGVPRRFETSTRNLREDFPWGCNSSSYLVYTSITQA